MENRGLMKENKKRFKKKIFFFQKFSIPSLRVDSPKNLKINGKDWPMNTYAPPAISLKVKF